MAGAVVCDCVVDNPTPEKIRLDTSDPNVVGVYGSEIFCRSARIGHFVWMHNFRLTADLVECGYKCSLDWDIPHRIASGPFMTF